MARRNISAEAASKGKAYTEEAQTILKSNVNALLRLNQLMSGFQDHAIKKIEELHISSTAQIKSICDSLEGIQAYCDEIIKWVSMYTEG